MNEKKEVFKFKLNETVNLTLKFDQPKTGEGQYGTWYLYGAMINGKEETFFASEGLHRDIQKFGLKAGDTFSITKIAFEGEDGKTKTRYEVKTDAQMSTAKRFEKDLDKTTNALAQQTKDKTILKIAIAKSLIESGKSWCPETRQEADRWVDWCEGRSLPLKPPTINPSASSEPTEEQMLQELGQMNPNDLL